MRWRDGVWSAYQWVLNTAIEATANTLNTFGSLACIAGGAGYALSYAVNEVINGAYYGAANGDGLVTLTAEMSQYSLFNDTLPLQDFAQTSGEISYNLQDLLHPKNIQSLSAILFTSGSVLRALGANMRQWQDGRIDISDFEHRGILISKPSLKEYLHANVESISGSISYACLSSAIVGAVIRSGAYNSEQILTYPSGGAQQINSSYYKGPVNILSFPIKYHIAKNISIDLFGEYILTSVAAKIDVMANVTYGGGLYLQEAKDFTNPPVAIPMVIGVTSYLVNNFFHKKRKELRDERIYKEITATSLYEDTTEESLQNYNPGTKVLTA